jgi:hypothetical protein
LRELGVQILATASAHQINAGRTAVNGDEDFSSVIGEMENLARVRRNSQSADGLSRLDNGQSVQLIIAGRLAGDRRVCDAEEHVFARGFADLRIEALRRVFQ